MTSTGTPSLDSLLAGHAGLVLGNLLLVEESGATDYAGILLRYYAAEGVLQDHRVHVIGAGDQWVRDLPGLATGESDKEERRKKKTSAAGDGDRMKIAWRYERFGGTNGLGELRGVFCLWYFRLFSRVDVMLSLPWLLRTIVADRSMVRAGSHGSNAIGSAKEDGSGPQKAYCHSFDLTKRLEVPNPAAINNIPAQASSAAASPFTNIISALDNELSSKPDIIHRIVVPGLLSPAFYPPWSSLPQHILQFFHALRSLLRSYPARVSAMLSLPITLYPRDTGLVRWIEILSDGILELTPFPHTVDTGPSSSTSGAATAQEEKPQGLAKIHKLPVFHERGGGGMSGSVVVGDDLAFTVTRRRFEIKPFSLPPVEGDTEAQQAAPGSVTKADLEF